LIDALIARFIDVKCEIFLVELYPFVAILLAENGAGTEKDKQQ
jgi:hypothetical protein